MYICNMEKEKEFIDFLKKEGCYGRFIKNAKHFIKGIGLVDIYEGYTPYHSIRELLSIDSVYTVGAAFRSSVTKEGWDFWTKIHDKWASMQIKKMKLL